MKFHRKAFSIFINSYKITLITFLWISIFNWKYNNSYIGNLKGYKNKLLTKWLPLIIRYEWKPPLKALYIVSLSKLSIISGNTQCNFPTNIILAHKLIHNHNESLKWCSESRIVCSEAKPHHRKDYQVDLNLVNCVYCAVFEYISYTWNVLIISILNETKTLAKQDIEWLLSNNNTLNWTLWKIFQYTFVQRPSNITFIVFHIFVHFYFFNIILSK